jgi:hypothetical protein
MSYKAGDKVWCDFRRDTLGIVGDQAAVIVGPALLTYPEGPEWIIESVPHPHNGSTQWHTWTKRLRPRRDPDEYDGNRVVKWDDCPWQPEKVLVER